MVSATGAMPRPLGGDQACASGAARGIAIEAPRSTLHERSWRTRLDLAAPRARGPVAPPRHRQWPEVADRDHGGASGDPAASATAITSRVAHRAAGLDEGRDPGRQADLDRVGERVERVRRARGTASASAPEMARALSTACRAASTREVWPEPRPTSRPSRTSTIAFEVARTRRQARSRSRRSASVGARRVATVQVGRVVRRRVRRRDEDRATGRLGWRRGVGRGREPSEREGRIDDQPEVGLAGQDRERVRRRTPGATTTSRKIDAECLRRRPDRPAGLGDHATERRDRIAGQRPCPGLVERRALRRHRTGWCA